MKFANCKEPLTEDDIASFERSLGLHFPESLKNHYLRANGGQPDPCVYEDDQVSTIVSENLPLRHGKGSAIDAYEILVLSKGFVPRHFFPFAADAGGDCFFVDCSSERGMVYLYQHDIGAGDDPLIDLKVSLDEFWSGLKPDE